MSKYLRTASLICAFLVAFSFALPPKNVILLIGDGMGFEQVKAAGMYAYGSVGTLSFESLPYQAQCTTYSADSSVTDSAAAATAIATGQKVNNGVISLATPGDNSELQTLLEYFESQDKDTGLVTTVYISHATPAAFGAHEPSRGNYTNIINDYLNQTKPNILMGGANYISSSAATAAGYTVVTDRTSLQAINTNTVTYLSGQFGGEIPYEYDGVGSLPHLSEMTATALDILDNDPDGFFLMVEGGKIDWAGHANDIRRNIRETMEFSNTTQVILDWAAGRTDTLIIVTADHETGGLTAPNITQGVYPSDVGIWSSTGHTGVNVPVYATGVNAELISGIMDNTDFFHICTSDEIPADRDGDLDVDLVDFSQFSLQWQNGTGLSDLLIFADSWLSGISRFALRFDGLDDYVEIPSYTGIAGPNSRTCSAWVKTISSQQGLILSWGSSADGQKWMFRIESDGTLGVGVWGGYIKTSQTVNDGQWHHVAAVFSDGGSLDISEIQLYIDGVLETSPYVSNSRQIQTSALESVLIGARLDTDGVSYVQFFQGLIDDVRIYERALSDVEISSINSIENDLVAHWKMDEGSGNTVQDSVSSYTGTIYGIAEWSSGK